MTDASRSTPFADALGPEKIVRLHDGACGLNAILVIDNTAVGPSLGGVRMTLDGSEEECFRLARAMTLKNAMAGLAHGGGKSIILADPALPADGKRRLLLAFARAIRDIRDYIPGPDMGTNETAMALIRNQIGRAAGLPREVGGIPLDEIGATGFGLCVALEAAQAHSGVNLAGARVVIQGFGSVGRHAARFLSQRGATIVGVSDSVGARAVADGFDLEQLIAWKDAGHSVTTFAQGTAIDEATLLATECDIWIPAARPDVITAASATTMRTHIIAQGANIPATAEAEALLARQGVLVLPDFVANAGGVICAAVEYAHGSQAQALATIDERIRTNVQAMLDRVRQNHELPREAAFAIARERVQRAMQWRD
ncbi:MAG: Glu/Leu/Phe/Val dehydrogenase [Pseudomonadales bacterium]|nr:Glu/Leu/Phe/Val dehydrogenase [Pseudomonadales bacterium]MCP5184644.1 Glu/Leu/Phe/Val dehydrogenase [Pseudomonadales bacterium]